MERIRSPDPCHPVLRNLFALYEQSFPLYERRTFSAQQRLLSQSDYRCDGLLVQGKPVGLLWY